MFGWLSRKKQSGAGKVDPIAAFDGAIESIERQGAEVRRSAATLLALRSELLRDQKKYTARLAELDERRADAAREADGPAGEAFDRDRGEARQMLEKTHEALASAEVNAALLFEAAEGLGLQAASLRAERQSARARLSAGLVVSEALQNRAAEFDRLMKLDAARDEIERAQALADLYREDAAKKR